MRTSGALSFAIRNTLPYARYFSITTISEGILLGAGLGTRLRPFTMITPKPLLPVMGIPSLQFSLDLFHESGIKSVCVNAHYLADEMVSGIQGLDAQGMSIVLSDERKKLLGSGGGIRTAMNHLGAGPFLVGNADILAHFDGRALIDAHFRCRDAFGAQLTLGLKRLESVSLPYREFEWDPKTGRILSLGEPLRTGWFYASFAVMERELFDSFHGGEYFDFVEKYLKPAIVAGKVGGHEIQGPWLDIGTPEAWAEAHFSLMDLWETHSLPQSWRRRMEEKNIRLSDHLWVDRRCRVGDEVDLTLWKRPVYLAMDAAPLTAGPRLIHYASGSSLSASSNSIVFEKQISAI